MTGAKATTFDAFSAPRDSCRSQRHLSAADGHVGVLVHAMYLRAVPEVDVVASSRGCVPISSRFSV